MVYTLKNVRQNIQFDEMPVDNIVYSRTGGCFISIIKGIILAATIVSVGCLLGLLIFYTTRQAYKISHEKSIQEFITEPQPWPPSLPKSLKNILPKSYRLLIQPIFNADERPFSYNGTIYITIVPLESNVLTIELDAKNLHIDTSKVFLNRKILNKNNDTKTEESEKRTKRNAFADEFDSSSPTGDGVLETSSLAVDIRNVSYSVSESSTMETTSHKSEYEFLELTTGLDGIAVDESEEITNHTGETLTTPRINQVEFSVHSDVRKNLYTEMLIKKIFVDKKRHKIIISLSLRLFENTEYILRLDFVGNMTKSGAGLIYTSYKDDAGNENFFAATVSDVHESSLLFPCFDSDPKFLTTFDASIVRNINMNTVSNAELKNTESYDSKLAIDHYKTTLPIGLKDFGFTVTQLQPTIVTINDDLSVYAYFRTEILPILTIVDNYVPAILNALENKTGVIYPNHKINLVGVPSALDSISSVKSSLLIASEKNFIVQSDSQKNAQLADVTLLLATMWFNILIDHQQIEETWINDAIPTYLHLTVLENITNSTILLNEIYLQQRIDSLNNDLLLSKLISFKDSTSDYISRKISSIQSDKARGLFLLKIFESILGPDNFTEAIQQHCERRVQGISSSLLEHFQKVLFDNSIDNNFGSFSRLWMRTHRYPLVVAESIDVSDNLLITQEIFGAIHSAEDALFSIPINILAKNDEIDANSFVFLTSYTTELPLYGSVQNGSWVIINHEGIGYYRVNYNAENWELLLDYLKENFTDLSPITRTLIIDDAFNLARYGYLNYSILFDLLNCWRTDESNYFSWKTVLNNIDFIYQHSTDLVVFKDIKEFIINLITPTYQRVVQSPINGKSMPLKILINRWACKLDIIYCIESMKKSFHNLIENGTVIKSQRSDDELRIVFCNAMKFGDKLEYEVIEKSLRTDNIDYNRLIVWALGCTRDQNYLQNYFNFLLNDTFKQYVPEIIASTIENKIGKIILLEMIYNRFEEIINHIALDNLMPLFESISTEFDMKMLDSIYSKHSKFFGDEYRSPLKYVVQNINSILQWKKSFANDLDNIDWKAYNN